jgi:2-oxoglutarate ferredoxin oxidoreductase subunit beta
MYKWMKKAAVPIERYNELTEAQREDRLPIGVFVERDRAGFEERYYELKSSFRKQGAKGGK